MNSTDRTPSGRWTTAAVHQLRSEGDPEADRVAADHFAADSPGPSDLFRRMARRQTPADSSSDPIAVYLDSRPDPPDWLDPAAVERAQRWFGRVGSHMFCALYAGSLPTAYACHQGARVLETTARLETDARRRLNETAQFLLDVNRPGGMEPGGSGYVAVRRVRLMHAGVRWLIEHDDRVQWDVASLGRPVNQEDLLLTLLTFTQVVFEGFDRTGVEYSAAEADDYLHLWSWAGYLLGIRADLLPLDRVFAAELMHHVREAHFGRSSAGRYLGAALLDQARDAVPPGLRGLPATAVRWFAGEAVADLLDMPPADWTNVLFRPMARLSRRLSRERWHERFLSELSGRYGRLMLTIAVDAARGGDRAAFSIPDELAPGLRAGRRGLSSPPWRRSDHG